MNGRLKKGEPITPEVAELFRISRLFEQEIKENIVYIGHKQGISIYRLFKELAKNGAKTAKSNFYKKPDDPRPNRFMSTIIFCNIAKVMGVPPNILFSLDIQSDYQKYVVERRERGEL